MNLPFAMAAAVAMIGAAIHGVAGERLILRRLRVENLHATRFGGPSSTLGMLRASWHIVTVMFLSTAVGLGVCSGLPVADGCRGVGLLTAGAYGVVFLGMLVRAIRRPATLVRHPGPAAFALVTLFAWLGA